MESRDDDQRDQNDHDEVESHDGEGLYIQLISVHGLIRGRDLELGRDADTGGQVTYVLELARALAAHPSVDRVDLLTRRIDDPRVGEDYSRETEELAPGASIVRLECGGRRYIRKELLWPHLDSFADQVLRHTRSVGRIPDVIHSHYADAGYVGALISGFLGAPQVHTGHSLGRVKRQRLLDKGLKPETVESKYNISTRIEAEEQALDNASLVVASTHQEVREQYALYDNYQPKRMVVIPPGVDLDRFRPPDRRWRRPRIQAEVERFLREPKKPIILAISRADPRKNVGALVRAYAITPELRDMANLVLVLGNRDSIRSLDKEPREVLTEVLHLIDDHDLHGHVAYPKHHEADDIPRIYRLAAHRRGVFVNPALTEPFGLTLIEAAASGLPVVATNDGGPQDIIENCKHGMLVDPLDAEAMGKALRDALSDRRRWRGWSRNAVRGAHRHYSWSGHVGSYLRVIRNLTRKTARRKVPAVTGTRLPLVERLLITDIDNTLIGSEEGLEALKRLLEESRIGFGIATGRNIDSARRVLKKWKVPDPDVWLTSVGSEINYGSKVVPDAGWDRHIEYRWDRDRVVAILADIRGLRLQGAEGQRKHKVSYYADPKKMPPIRDIARALRKDGLAANLIYSHGAYLDVLPIRASKGRALRFLAVKWGLPVESILVAGDSGNDEEMLTGDTRAIVVGNHSDELGKLRGRPNVYFATGEYAHGIVEGIEHYRFLEARSNGEWEENGNGANGNGANGSGANGSGANGNGNGAGERVTVENGSAGEALVDTTAREAETGK